MDQRLKTIRLVTERYTELQGLRLAFPGAILAVTCGALLIAQAQQRAVLIAVIVAFSAMLPCQWLLNCYYTARFGRIVRPTSRVAGAWLIGSMAVALILTGEPFGPGQMAATFAIGAAGALWVAVRDWPLRAHHLLGCAAAAGGASIQFVALHSEFLPRAQATAFLIFGLTYIVVGLLDHRLLTSVVGPGDREAGLKSCATKKPQ